MSKSVNKFVLSLLMTGLLLPVTGWSHVDPVWLGQWNEALANRPETIESSARIAAADETGAPLVIHGRVVDPEGEPAADVIVHSYHRDDDGFELGTDDREFTSWELQGWAKTDAEGRFKFRTIRPKPDYLGREAAHVHFTLESAEFGRQWAPKIFFDDDAMVTSQQRRRSKRAGELGVVRPVITKEGVQHVDVLLQLKPKADF